LKERFFDSINTLIAYMDREFNFIRVNDAFARQAQYHGLHTNGRPYQSEEGPFFVSLLPARRSRSP